jgi:hypothetical protein
MLAEFLCSHDAEIVKAAQPPWDADMGRPTEDLFAIVAVRVGSDGSIENAQIFSLERRPPF